MRDRAASLPVEDVLPALVDALKQDRRAVLQAPPGAGKTTRVPLALLDVLTKGRILILEPRRVAARGAAHRMADTLREQVGETVGYRMRGASKTSARTRIEVITEGLFTRLLQRDPELTGIAAVVFDEFHERSLHTDLGLALALEVASAFRPDLWLLVMSATLDAAPVAEMIGARVITSEGRQFPVTISHASRPMANRYGHELARTVATAVHEALHDPGGDILVFLPGEADIHRVASQLAGLDNAEVERLYGAMPLHRQAAVLQPSPRRRVVLATAIAETSLTVPGVDTVIDAGLAKRSRFDPRTGMARLVTERASRAEADQRAGRAGRLGPGRAIRLWTRGEEGGMSAFGPPEVLTGDLSAFALDLAAWGAAATDLRFLTPPAEGAMAQAEALLTDLGALKAGRPTEHGLEMLSLPLHPRLAHMMLEAGRLGSADKAATLAALLETGLRGSEFGVDLSLRIDAYHQRRLPKPVSEQVRDASRRIQRGMPTMPPSEALDQVDIGALLSLAYPDRIARARLGDGTRYLLSSGHGARLAGADDLAGQTWLAVAELDGSETDARIRLAASLSRAEIEDFHRDRITELHICRWDPTKSAVVSHVDRRLGAVVLTSRPWPDPPPDEVRAALFDGIRQMGISCLPWTKNSRQIVTRAAYLARADPEFPDLSELALAATLEDWLGPYVSDMRRAEDLERLALATALQERLGWEARQKLDRNVPKFYVAPTGTKVSLDYDGENPTCAIRLQELFGCRVHPTVGPHRIPIRFELLSPAGRPVQTTMDLPGFWTSSYADVRADMRGRYPKHPWPEDPVQSEPTRRAKPSNRR